MLIHPEVIPLRKEAAILQAETLALHKEVTVTRTEAPRLHREATAIVIQLHKGAVATVIVLHREAVLTEPIMNHKEAVILQVEVIVLHKGVPVVVTALRNVVQVLVAHQAEVRYPLHHRGAIVQTIRLQTVEAIHTNHHQEVGVEDKKY